MKTFLFVIIFLVFLSLAAYWLRQERTKTPRLVRVALVTGHRTKEDGCQVHGPLQDKKCTPGAVFQNVTAERICVRGYAKSVRFVPAKVKHEVYREYGISHHRPGEYEVDHLISLELGGSNDIANLWPEAAEPRPGFHEKDKIENYLHDQVCSGRMDLWAAQSAIANDWLSIYNASP